MIKHTLLPNLLFHNILYLAKYLTLWNILNILLTDCFQDFHTRTIDWSGTYLYIWLFNFVLLSFRANLGSRIAPSCRVLEGFNCWRSSDFNQKCLTKARQPHMQLSTKFPWPKEKGCVSGFCIHYVFSILNKI